MQEPSNVGKIALVSIWWRIDYNLGIQRYPPNINKLTGITILIPKGRFFDIIVNVDY